MNGLRPAGRIAFRAENEYWHAYYADSATMDGAVLLGSISIGAIEFNPERRSVFIELMQGIVSDIIEDRMGEQPVWGEYRVVSN